MWFIIATLAFFLLALAAVIDKYLLNQTKIVPISFAFYIAFFAPILGSVLLFFEPNFSFPRDQLVTIIIGGISLFFGLYWMFLALAKSEVSKINPLVVSFTPLFVFLLSLLLGLELVSFYKVVGSAMIIIGGYYLSQVGAKETRLKLNIWLLVIFSAIMWGLTNTYSKIAYDSLSFINAFWWLRIVTLITAVVYVTLVGGWKKVFSVGGQQTGKTGLKNAFVVLVIGQAAGSLGVLFLQYAINLGNVILITALNGIQFFFVILLVYIFSRFFPKILKENIVGKFLVKKIIWSIVLFLGVFLALI